MNPFENVVYGYSDWRNIYRQIGKHSQGKSRAATSVGLKRHSE